MKNKVVLGLRLVLGLMLVVFGLNGFFQFLPMPPPTPEGGAYLGALAGTGYFFPFLKATEVLVGVALLSGFFVPLALVVLAPISIQILLYHMFLDTSNVVMALFIFGVNLALGLLQIQAYKPLLTAKASN
ncbi:MAG: acyltransferase [Bdellovibrionales bacterium]|nr:acyltransferase [Bdellovibrionales bacterium]